VIERTQSAVDEERFTRRLEAFSDLVFGFSLSLLATRLEVPTTPADILDRPKVIAIAVTFAVICLMWLQHYRIFRHHFVARPFEVATNFVFLFALAGLPYALQTFLRFPAEPAAVALYLGDFSLIFVALATLRLRGLLQRPVELDNTARLRDWRRVIIQYVVAAIMVGMISATIGQVIDPRRPFELLGGVIIVVAMLVRTLVRRVPGFLKADAPAASEAQL
jgi:uncharacterized membrane protein